MKRLWRPRVFIPTLLGLGLLAGLISFANVGEIADNIIKIRAAYVLYFFLLMVVYEFLRGCQWRYLLTAQHINAPLKEQVLAFLLSEITKNMPLGNYFQNYLLMQQHDSAGQRTDIFARTSAATTFIVVAQVAVGVAVVAVSGLGQWSLWLRPVILIGTPATALIVAGIYYLYRRLKLPQFTVAKSWRHTMVAAMRSFLSGARDILSPSVVGITLFFSLAYMLIASVALWVAAAATGGSGNLSLWDFMAVYCFSIAFSLVIPIPIDVGVTEAGGTGALLALGATRLAAVSAVVTFRLLNVLSAIVIVLLSLPFLHHELSRAMHGKSPVHKRPMEHKPTLLSQA